MRIELHNLDGTGDRRTRVYDMPPREVTSDGWPAGTKITQRDYWAAVSDVPCPIEGCAGIIRWAEAGYVPGYRICDGCGRHFIADGTADAPVLLRCGQQRSRVDPLSRIRCDVEAWLWARNEAKNEDVLTVDAAHARDIGFPTLSSIASTIDLVHRGHDLITREEILNILREVLSIAVGEATERLRLVTGDPVIGAPGVPTLPRVLLEARI